MFILIILFLSLRLYSMIMPNTFEMKFKNLFVLMIILIVIIALIYSLLDKIAKDKNAYEEWNKKEHKEGELPPTYITFWHDNVKRYHYIWSDISVIIFVVIILNILYKLIDGRSYIPILKKSIVPALILDVVLFFDFCAYYSGQGGIKLIVYMILFEIESLFKTICYLGIIMFIIMATNYIV